MSADRSELIRTLHKEAALLAKRLTENRIGQYKPYGKQIAFHEAGKAHREVMLAAGNQLGKTYCGAAEMAYHLTGRYPEWWPGRRFRRAIRAWAGGVTGINTRDTVQRMLLGPLGQHGTGMIPKDTLMLVRPARGLADAVDTILVRHVSGDYSSLAFKSYEQGRAKWQSETIHALWLDEEPPEDIYTEALARITATKGFVFTTFTPLMGMTEVARRFFMEPSPDRLLVQMSIEDALHIDEAERARIIEGYPEHEREARTKGIPALGSGRVYPVSESVISVEPIPIPAHWPRICGIDFGWDHPTAVVWLAWDRDSDTVYLYDCYRAKQAIPAVHASAMRGRGPWIPVAWPHDGLAHDKGSGDQLAELYRKEGVNMLFTRAQFEDGSNSVEAGIQRILGRMQGYRFKVFSHLVDWFEEFRMYHRKDGLIAKHHDDLMDATRYAEMMLIYAQIAPNSPSGQPERVRRNWRTA